MEHEPRSGADAAGAGTGVVLSPQQGRIRLRGCAPSEYLRLLRPLRPSRPRRGTRSPARRRRCPST
jgi:hypothetical protein